MAGKVYYKDDLFYDLLRACINDPRQRSRVNRDKIIKLSLVSERDCPPGYKGITVFFKEVNGKE